MMSSNNNTFSVLDLSKLLDEEQIPGIGSVLGRMLMQACAVCLTHQQHQKGLILRVLFYNVSNDSRDIRGFVIDDWEHVTQITQRQWGDLYIAVEQAACALAILLIFDLTEYTIVERSRKGTGFDYWLGDKVTNELPFEHKARLEVSGLLNATSKQVKARVSQKIRQTRSSDDTGLPVFIGITEFSVPQTRIIKIEVDRNESGA